jgi:4-hydroxybenzoate polyprenyltransferase
MDRGIKDKGQPADYFFLLRPMILIPVWTFFLLGAWHGSKTCKQPISTVNVAAGTLSFTALLGAIYIINQITDRKADLANKKLFLIPHSIISIKSACIETVILLLISFTLAPILLPIKFTVILGVSFALGIAYSLEPVRLKKRPFLDVMANSIGNGVLNTLAGWFAIGAPAEGLEILAPYPLAVASVHMTTTLADIKGDRSVGLRTSGVITGERVGIAISVLLMLGAVAVAALVGNNHALLASLLSLPAFLIPARALGQEQKQQSNSGRSSYLLFPAKTATLVFSIVAGFLFPLYIPFLVVLILFTRLYYKKRFNMNYPSL